MDEYAQIYLSKLASECKEAGVLDFIKSVGKDFVVDPAVGMFTDTGSAIGSAAQGDWSAAGGSALSALGNTLMTAGNVASVVPFAGWGVGAGARALGLGAKALRAGSLGAKALGAARAGGVVSKLTNAQKILGSTGAVQTGAKGFVMNGARAAGSVFNPAIRSGLAGRLASKAEGVRQALGKLPLGGLTGFNRFNPALIPPMGRVGKALSVVKPIAAFTGLQIGADALSGGGLERQFDDLAVDPNFREWMGPDRQDAWLEKARTSADKINSMRELRDGGYLDTYKNHLGNTLREQQQRLSDEARLNGYDQVRRQNVG